MERCSLFLDQPVLHYIHSRCAAEWQKRLFAGGKEPKVSVMGGSRDSNTIVIVPESADRSLAYASKVPPGVSRLSRAQSVRPAAHQWSDAINRASLAPRSRERHNSLRLISQTRFNGGRLCSSAIFRNKGNVSCSR
jgi:hypothetical protein